MKREGLRERKKKKKKKKKKRVNKLGHNARKVTERDSMSDSLLKKKKKN